MTAKMLSQVVKTSFLEVIDSQPQSTLPSANLNNLGISFKRVLGIEPTAVGSVDHGMLLPPKIIIFPSNCAIAKPYLI